MQQEKAAGEVLAGSVQPVCDTLHKGSAEEESCPSDATELTYKHGSCRTGHGWWMPVFLPLLKIRLAITLK